MIPFQWKLVFLLRALTSNLHWYKAPLLKNFLSPARGHPPPSSGLVLAMSASSSSVVRVLQSPLSHTELYGTEHPLVARRESKRTTKKGRRARSCGATSLPRKTASGKSARGSRQGERRSKSVRTVSVTRICSGTGKKEHSLSTSVSSGKSNEVASDSAAKHSVKGGGPRAVISAPPGRNKDEVAILSVESTHSMSSQTHSNYHSDTTSCPLPPVEANSPHITKKTVNKCSISSSSSSSSSKNRQSWWNERRVRGAWISENDSVIKAVSGRTSKQPEKDRASKSDLSVPSETESVLTTSTTSHSLNSGRQRVAGPVVSSRWSKSTPTQPSRHPLPSPGVPRCVAALTTAAADGRGWSRGGRRQLELRDIAIGLGTTSYKHIIVMSGAGVSTPSGIPDFRSPGTGLYDNLQKYNLPEPSAVFDTAYFHRNPRPFFSLARELYPGRYSPSLVHCFLRLLQDKGVLLRNYTQNIDGLERLAGVQGGRLVEAHGSFSTASCTRCHSKQVPQEVKEAIFNGHIPKCKHKYCNGVVKPDIVFFGEDLPQRFHSLQLPDFSKCDLLFIMGTSLEVEPFASLVTLPRHTVPRVLLNRELVGPFRSSRCRLTDVAVSGDMVESVRVLAEGAGWWEELQEIQRTVCQETGLPAVSSKTTGSCTVSSSPHDECTQLTPAMDKLSLKDSTPSSSSTSSSSSLSSSVSSLSSESS